MRFNRRWLRNFVGHLIGVQGDLQVWWTPGLPLVYIANPKSGCSTIKHSLKEAQADAYARSGRYFRRIANEPHFGDDCLQQEWLAPHACRERYVISCVRNPFTRALSGFLDKVRANSPRALSPNCAIADVSTISRHICARSPIASRGTSTRISGRNGSIWISQALL